MFYCSFPISISLLHKSNRSVKKVILCSVTDYVKDEEYDLQYN